MSAPRILILENEPNDIGSLQVALQDLPLEIHVADRTAAGLRSLVGQRFHTVLCNLRMPGGGGLAVLRAARRLNLPPPVILLTGCGDEGKLSECLAAGAFDFLSKPVERFTLLAILRRALLQSGLICEASLPGPASRPTLQIANLVGTSPAMQEVLGHIAKVAAADANVCLYGESGTGKELVARAIHYVGPRAQQPLIVLDCAAIPEGLLESELFGHVKGAFTSAVSDREGLFQLADGGTLFLDEVAELPLPLQAKLLRVVQCREVRPVGGRHPIKVNVRLIAATHRDLRAQVQAGQFREDLFYRLEVLPITLPPLRARKADIPLLVEHFITEVRRHSATPLRGVSSRTIAAFLQHDWPGNVRELENCIERAAIMAEQEILDLPDLTPLLHRAATGAPAPGPLTWPCTLKDAERALILQTLQNVQGNRARAAELLGISLRSLHYKLRELRGTGHLPAARSGKGSNGSRNQNNAASVVRGPFSAAGRAAGDSPGTREGRALAPAHTAAQDSGQPTAGAGESMRDHPPSLRPPAWWLPGAGNEGVPGPRTAA